MKFKIEIPSQLFSAHLKPKDNLRIIFSGAFGTGKTYFLEEFFKSKSNYETIHLFPVNYSVASGFSTRLS